MSYNYISGNSNVLTEPAAKSCLSSKIQQCYISPQSPGQSFKQPPNFAPFKKPPACEFNFRTPNFFYPAQHTHTFKNSEIRHYKTRAPRTNERNVTFEETFKTKAPQVCITKNEPPHGKHVSFDESVLNQPMRESQIPKSPTIRGGQKGPVPPPKPVYSQHVPSSPETMREESSSSFQSSSVMSSAPPSQAHGMMNMKSPGNSQSFYQESSFETSAMTTSRSSSGPQPIFPTCPPPNIAYNPPMAQKQSQSPSSPYVPSTFKQSNLMTPKPKYADRNLSPIPFGSSNRNPSPVRHVNPSVKTHHTQLDQSVKIPSNDIPAPPPPPPTFNKRGPAPGTGFHKNTGYIGIQPPFGHPSQAGSIPEPKLPDMPFIPMENNELSPVVKETHRASSPGEHIFLSNGEIIPSDTKIMVKDQNAWYKQMSKTIHGLKGDMPMNRVGSWPK